MTTVARCVMWCGRTDGAAVTVIADRSSIVDLEDLLPDVVGHLDQEPLIHGAGGLGPTVAGLRELDRTRARLDRAQRELGELHTRHELLARARDEEVAALHARIARISTPWGALTFTARRWTSAAVRALRGLGGRRGRR
jgi:hypothetical protein